jgi:hypothetical protein
MWRRIRGLLLMMISNISWSWSKLLHVWLGLAGWLVAFIEQYLHTCIEKGHLLVKGLARFIAHDTLLMAHYSAQCKSNT